MTKDRYLQAVRGAAICAVVLIHCLPQCDASMVIRPFLNWGVAAFLFLSGYLTSEEKLKRGVLSGRLKKTLVPYVLWSIAYALFLHHEKARDHDDSHMQEKVSSLNSTFSFERYSYDERKALAKCVLMALHLLDAEHVKKQLANAGASVNEVESNLIKWEKEFSAPGD